MASLKKRISLINQTVDSVKDGESTLQFASKLGLSKGVSGYVYHSVPVAIHHISFNRQP
jgi:ADP-ribosyl-[dinitrogen reductase] hydrolase